MTVIKGGGRGMADKGDSGRVKLMDIARETGYSVNTVSRALRGMSDISAPTTERIRQVAREMGYTVNQLASSLRSGRTRLLAVIIGNLSNPYFGVVVDAIQDVAAARGYGVMIMCSREDAKLELEMVESAIARRVDGVMLFPTVSSAISVERLRAARTPFVLMARRVDGVAADSVVADEAEGARLAVRHLIDHGGRRLAYLSNHDIVFSGRMREEGFNRACDEAGVPMGDRLVSVFDRDDAGLPLPERLLHLKEAGFDSLFVFCDEEAWHVIDALQRTDGLDPGDFRIASFDNLSDNLAYPIPLCSVDCDYAGMARQGLELLRLRIHRDERPVQSIVCPTRLVCRGSCVHGGRLQ